MYYLYVGTSDICTVFYVKPESIKPIYEVESLPEGEGILKRAEDGSFYYEPFPEPEPPIEPEEPQPTSEEIQAQTLLNTELLLVYKEIGM